jgi:hypothetical protein
MKGTVVLCDSAVCVSSDGLLEKSKNSSQEERFLMNFAKEMYKWWWWTLGLQLSWMINSISLSSLRDKKWSFCFLLYSFVFFSQCNCMDEITLNNAFWEVLTVFLPKVIFLFLLHLYGNFLKSTSISLKLHWSRNGRRWCWWWWWV